MFQLKEYTIQPSDFPKELVRWGFFACVISILVGVGVVAYFPYVDAVRGEAELFLEGIPNSITAKTDGTLSIFEPEGTEVAKNEILAVINWDITKSRVQYYNRIIEVSNVEEYYGFKALLKEINEKDLLNSHPLEDQLYSLKSKLRNYISFVESSPLLKLIESNNVLGEEISQALAKIQELQEIQNEKETLLNSKNYADSLLNAGGVISDLDYLFSEVDIYNEEINQTEYKLRYLLEAQKITSIQFENKEILYEDYVRKFNYRKEILDEITVFRKMYSEILYANAVYSPINGSISWNERLLWDSHCDRSDLIGKVYPSEKVETVKGYLLVTPKKAGQIKKGMPIQIELNEFPVSDFGSVNTNVDYIKKMNNVDLYMVWFTLKVPITTSYAMKINPQNIENVSGTGKIVVNKKSLLIHVWDEFKSSIDRNI